MGDIPSACILHNNIKVLSMTLFTVNSNIHILCKSSNTHNGFKHTATLLYGGVERETATCRYVNRTWERYRYESVLERLLDETIALNDAERVKFADMIIKG